MNNISYDQAINLIRSYNIILLDVQTEIDYSKKHLAGSINIPIEKIKFEAEKIINDKNKIIIVYCLSGIRSVAACDMLERLGYKNVYNIKGGIDS